jgi:hypothetical protein
MPDNQFWRDASERLTFGMFAVPADSYRAIYSDVAATFQLLPHDVMVTNGWNIVFQDYRRGEQVVGLEWDNWTGFCVGAKTPASEPLVQEIAAWLLESPWAKISDPA